MQEQYSCVQGSQSQPSAVPHNQYGHAMVWASELGVSVQHVKAI